jgi:6-phosphofructokinase 1
LGIGVKKIFDEGLTGCMVSSDPTGDIFPLFLKDLEDGHGKVRTRMVTMDSQKAHMVFFDSIQYLTASDMEGAKEYLKNPEEFDFMKILEW